MEDEISFFFQYGMVFAVLGSEVDLVVKNDLQITNFSPKDCFSCLYHMLVYLNINSTYC